MEDPALFDVEYIFPQLRGSVQETIEIEVPWMMTRGKGTVTFPVDDGVHLPEGHEEIKPQTTLLLS